VKLKKLPVGIENFSEFSTDNFYYVDKTGLIIDLLNNWEKVNLFIRTRRFGKSLNMSMLKVFFKIGCDKNPLKVNPPDNNSDSEKAIYDMTNAI
jgi:hypothetical protein